jgi:hypothetical protein
MSSPKRRIGVQREARTGLEAEDGGCLACLSKEREEEQDTACRNGMEEEQYKRKRSYKRMAGTHEQTLCQSGQLRSEMRTYGRGKKPEEMYTRLIRTMEMEGQPRWTEQAFGGFVDRRWLELAP